MVTEPSTDEANVEQGIIHDLEPLQTRISIVKKLSQETQMEKVLIEPWPEECSILENSSCYMRETSVGLNNEETRRT